MIQCLADRPVQHYPPPPFPWCRYRRHRVIRLSLKRLIGHVCFAEALVCLFVCSSSLRPRLIQHDERVICGRFTAAFSQSIATAAVPLLSPRYVPCRLSLFHGGLPSSGSRIGSHIRKVLHVFAIPPSLPSPPPRLFLYLSLLSSSISFKRADCHCPKPSSWFMNETLTIGGSPFRWLEHPEQGQRKERREKIEERGNTTLERYSEETNTCLMHIIWAALLALPSRHWGLLNPMTPLNQALETGWQRSIFNIHSLELYMYRDVCVCVRERGRGRWREGWNLMMVAVIITAGIFQPESIFKHTYFRPVLNSDQNGDSID